MAAQKPATSGRLSEEILAPAPNQAAQVESKIGKKYEVAEAEATIGLLQRRRSDDRDAFENTLVSDSTMGLAVSKT